MTSSGSLPSLLMMENLTTSVSPWYQHLLRILRFYLLSSTNIDFIISIFSMLTSMALRMGLSSMMDRTLDLLFSKGLRLSQLNCKTFQFWSKIINFLYQDWLYLGQSHGIHWSSDGRHWWGGCWWAHILIYIEYIWKYFYNYIRNWLQTNQGVQVPGW